MAGGIVQMSGWPDHLYSEVAGCLFYFECSAVLLLLCHQQRGDHEVGGSLVRDSQFLIRHQLFFFHSNSEETPR